MASFFEDPLNIGLFTPSNEISDFDIFSEILQTVVTTKKEADKIENKATFHDINMYYGMELLDPVSKSGFVFKLNAPNLKYVKLNGEPVTELIMKIACISRDVIPYYFCHTNDYNTGDIVPFHKKTMTLRNVFNETKIQQDIWLESIKSGIPICPCVGNVLIIKRQFLNNRKNHLLMSFIRLIENTYLQTFFKDGMHNQPIGGVSIFLMENIDGDVFDSKNMIHLFPKVIATIIRLFFIGFLQFDLIDPNILVTRNGVIKLIDFEYASNIIEVSSDILFNDSEKTLINVEREKFLTKYNIIVKQLNDVTKSKHSTFKKKTPNKRSNKGSKTKRQSSRSSVSSESIFKEATIIVLQFEESKLMFSIMNYIYKITNDKRTKIGLNGRHLEWYDAIYSETNIETNSMFFHEIFNELRKMHTPILNSHQIHDCERRCFRNFTLVPQVEENCTIFGGSNKQKYKKNRIKKKRRILSKKIKKIEA